MNKEKASIPSEKIIMDTLSLAAEIERII